MTPEPRHRSGVAEGYPIVQGVCPKGCGKTLFLGKGGYVTCSWLRCPDPSAASKSLGNIFPVPEHPKGEGDGDG